MYTYVREGEAGRKLVVVYNSNEREVTAGTARLRTHLGEGARWRRYDGAGAMTGVPAGVELERKEAGVFVVE